MSILSAFIFGLLSSICETFFLYKGKYRFRYRRALFLISIVATLFSYTILVVSAVPLVQLFTDSVKHKAIYITEITRAYMPGTVKLSDHTKTQFYGSSQINRSAYKKSAVYRVEYVPFFDYITKVIDSRGYVIYTVLDDCVHGFILSFIYMVRVGFWVVLRKKEGLL